MVRQVYRRKLIQLGSAVLYNLNFKGFAEGTISASPTKGVCVPGINCYSCPGAIGACPLGSIQASLNSLPNRISVYVLGMLMLFGVFLGRAVCAFLCPIGLIQELLYKIPSPKLKKSIWTRRLSWLKYIILGIFVLAIPVYTLYKNGVADPGFCKYICPAGTLEGGIPLVTMNASLRMMTGALFDWKVALLAIFLISSVYIYRPFCRFICPLGAIYSFFNRVAIFGIRVDESKCTNCGACTRTCKMDVKKVNDHECIRCGECKERCKFDAL